MPHPDGAHTHGGSSAGLGAPLMAGLGLFLAAAILPALLAILHALIIALALTAGVAAAAGAGLVIWRAHRPAAVPPWQPGTLRAAQQPTVAPREVHLHIHGAAPADIAAALAQLPAATATPPPTWASHNHPAAREDQP